MSVKGGKIVFFMKNQDAGSRLIVSLIKNGSCLGTEANEYIRKK